MREDNIPSAYVETVVYRLLDCKPSDVAIESYRRNTIEVYDTGSVIEESDITEDQLRHVIDALFPVHMMVKINGE